MSQESPAGLMPLARAPAIDRHPAAPSQAEALRAGIDAGAWPLLVALIDAIDENDDARSLFDRVARRYTVLTGGSLWAPYRSRCLARKRCGGLEMHCVREAHASSPDGACDHVY